MRGDHFEGEAVSDDDAEACARILMQCTCLEGHDGVHNIWAGEIADLQRESCPPAR
jgi:hypothetical protein